MKKKLLLLPAAAAALTLLLSCEQPTAGGPDLSGVLRLRSDLTAEQWNAGHDDYFNKQWYSFVTAVAWSEEAAAPNLSVVSWADEDSAEYAAHTEFLMATQGYGYGKFLWRVYGTDPEAPFTDNGFAAGDTVQVSIDIWVPDLAGLALKGAWFDILTAGTTCENPTAVPPFTWGDATPVNEPLLVRLVKYHSNDVAYATGSGGWITLTQQVVVDANGVVDVLVKLGNQNDNQAMTVYFDNLEVTKVTTP